MHRLPAWRTWHVRLSQHLDEHKEAAGVVDADIADKIGVSRASITHWKAGRRTPQLDNFFALCEAIDADPEFILFGHTASPTGSIDWRLSNLSPEARDAVMLALEGAEARARAHKKTLAS